MKRHTTQELGHIHGAGQPQYLLLSSLSPRQPGRREGELIAELLSVIATRFSANQQSDVFSHLKSLQNSILWPSASISTEVLGTSSKVKVEA